VRTRRMRSTTTAIIKLGSILTGPECGMLRAAREMTSYRSLRACEGVIQQSLIPDNTHGQPGSYHDLLIMFALPPTTS